MGSDYHMQTIDRWETINGVEVPVSTWGAYLNHECINEDRTKALDLTTPYGILEYAVGNGECDEECDGDWTMFFDFAELPDGRIVLDSTCNSESGGFIMGVGYEVCTKEDAPSVALGMVALACDGVADNEVRHDSEGWGQDEYYFVRAVAAACGIEPYASAGYGELRRGERPDFSHHGYERVLGNG